MAHINANIAVGYDGDENTLYSAYIYHTQIMADASKNYKTGKEALFCIISTKKKKTFYAVTQCHYWGYLAVSQMNSLHATC